jgi:DNA helicase HerA-like ATPase
VVAGTMGGLELGTEPSGETLTFKSDRLTTHGVVVGMTGSGKTGLCLVLLEELVAAGVPVLAIDPKGDLGNLGLVFPGLAPEDFAPWVGDEDPRTVAESWRAGLERAGIGSDRVRQLRERLSMRVYTPGSTAGIPIDLLSLLDAPPEDVRNDPESRTTMVAAAVSGLLGLVGRPSDPVKDPAHVVLSHLVDEKWREGEGVDLSTLVLQLVDPPFEKVGLFPVDTFFDPDARMELAMRFNALLSAPSFASWRTGEALDLDERLAESDRRTPVSVFNVAHLQDAQRQFFISLLLSRLLAWSRRQPGTSRLRGLVFFDEVSGYLPPYPHNPATKAPLLTLMKQARAVGLGVVLSTQNPVDLDYKALSNAGTWAIGRLSTRQDRDRLLKGIEADGLDATVAGLAKRQFVLHQVGRGAPATFSSRHAMCYLRGPLTQVEVGSLNALFGVRYEADAERSKGEGGPSGVAGEAGLSVAPTVSGVDVAFLDPRVVFSARMEGRFEAFAEPARDDGTVLHRPALFARLRLRFDETRRGFVLDEELTRLWFPLGENGHDEPLPVRLEPEDLRSSPPPESVFAPLPGWCDEPGELKRLREDVVDSVHRSEARGQFVNPELKLYARSDESRADFEARCEAAVEAAIDAEAAKLNTRFEKKAERVQDQIERKQAQLVEHQGVVRSHQMEEVVNLGATILSFFGGRKRSLTTAVSKRRQSSRAQAKVGRLESDVAELQEEAIDLEEELEAALQDIRIAHRAALDATEVREVGLEKSDIDVVSFGLMWVPVSRRL